MKDQPSSFSKFFLSNPYNFKVFFDDGILKYLDVIKDIDVYRDGLFFRETGERNFTGIPVILKRVL